MEKWLVSSLNNLPPKERYDSKGVKFPNPFALAEIFHENSKFYPNLMSLQLPHNEYLKPNYTPLEDITFTNIPDYPDLPTLDSKIGEVLLSRRSSWDFKGPISFIDFAVLLQYSFGVTSLKEVSLNDGSTITLRFRSYPSGGALYPIEIYLYVRNVTGIERGLYSFSPYDRRLSFIEGGSHLEEQINALLPSTDPNRNPLFPAGDYSHAAVQFFLAADFKNQADKYGLRAYRLTLLEAGHMAQNLLLVATALGMEGIPLAGFYDDRANKLFQLDGVEKSMIYLIPVGGKRGGVNGRNK